MAATSPGSTYEKSNPALFRRTRSKSLNVPPTAHQLNVQLVPSKPQYQPGESATYTIKASDASGKPMIADFSLGVVDEAIYGVRPETTHGAGTGWASFRGLASSRQNQP